MSYKKRGRAGWVGKKEAKGKMSRERNFSKEEIREELKMIDEGDSYRTSHKPKKILTKEQKTEKKLAWYERTLEYWTRDNNREYAKNGMMSSFINSLRSGIKKLKGEK